MTRTSRVAVPASALALGLLAACGSGGGSSTATTAGTTTAPGATTTASPGTTAASGVSAEGISAERCQANKDAGKITYLSGFDFAATSSIIEVVMADEKGYFKKMCLDVDLKSSFSTENYPLVSANQAQFASGGSYGEVADYGAKNGSKIVVLAQDGKVGIDALLVKPESGIKKPEDVKGKTIGVKGALTPSVRAMLSKAGLTEGKDFKTVSLDGFDPKVHITLPIDGFPVYKNNEPGQLQAAGIPFEILDPVAYEIPGSFGILYANADFVKNHPTAAQDFIRASMRGMEDAIADPNAAIAVSLDRIRAGGNKNFLSDEGETFRWTNESKLIVDNSKGKPVGWLDPALLKNELDALLSAGAIAGPKTIDGTYDADVIAGVYGSDGKVIWPEG